MKCKKCGKEFEEGVFCPNCGERVEEGNINIEEQNLVNPTPKKQKVKKKKTIGGCLLSIVKIIVVTIVLLFIIGLVFGDEGEKTEIEKTEEKNSFAEMDFEELIGKSKEDLQKIGLKTGEDYSGYAAMDGDIQVSCTDGMIDLIMITGNTDVAPAFHGVRLGMSETEIKEKLSDKYTEELEGMNGKMYVNLDNCDAVNCQIEDGKVKTIMYTKLSEEELSELYRSSMADEYIFPDSDVKYLSEDEVRSVEADKLALGRNEIFARHGYIFKDESFRQYFEGTSWYEGTVSSDQFNADSVFNDFEKKNVELIKKIEDEVNGTSSDEFIGLGGVYICTTPLWDGFTGKIELGQPQNGAMSFSLGVLEQSYNILSGTAVIIDSHTAQVKADGVSITLTWSNSENMYVVNEGSYSGKDADTIDVITDNMSYIRPTEFNQ